MTDFQYKSEVLKGVEIDDVVNIWAPAWENQQFWILTRSDTNQAVQLLEMARGLKFCI